MLEMQSVTVQIIKSLVGLLLLCAVASLANADAWRTGKIKNYGSSYNGSSITFRLKDISDGPAITYANCTCDPSWQDLCLNPARTNFDQEFAMLVSAHAQNLDVRIIFSDSSCFVTAFVIPDQ